MTALQLPQLLASESASRDWSLRVRLRDILVRQAIVRRGERSIVSRTGGEEAWILDVRSILLSGDALNLVTTMFWERFGSLGSCQIAGSGMGAVPLIGALVQKANQLGIDANGLVVRSSRNKHGLQNVIEGALSDAPIVVVDDLVNSAASLEQIRVTLEDHGRKPAAVFVIVDFATEAARQWRQGSGIPVHALYELHELGLERTSPVGRAPLIQHSFDTVWQYRGQEAPDLFHVMARSSPVVDDQRLYVGTSGSEFIALDTRDGALRWSFMTSRLNRKGIASSPALFGDLVYFGAYDGNVYALHADSGSVEWASPVADHIGSSPALAGELGLMFIGLEHELDGEKGSLAALDLKTGEIAWRIPTREYLHASPVYCPERGIVITGTNDGDCLIAEAESGRVLWRRPLGGNVKMAPAISLAHNALCVGAMDGTLSILDIDTGETKAIVRAESGIYTTPLVVGDQLFFCSTDKRFYAVDLREGRLVGLLSSKARCFGSPALIGNHIYFGNNAGTVYEIDPLSLHLTGRHQLPDRIVSRIAYCADAGCFYAHTSDARIFAFRRSDVSASPLGGEPAL